MTDDRTFSLERWAFVALVVVLLAPVLAQGLWRPLIHVVGPAGSAGWTTAGALAIGGASVLVQRLYPRRALALSLGLGALLAVGATVGLALGAAGLVTLATVAVASAVGVRWLLPRLPPGLDGLARRHRALTALYLAAALLAAVSTVRVSIFMGDPTRVDQQVLPSVHFLDTHSCLTAYVRADTLSRQHVDNLYDAPWWRGSHGYPPRAAGDEDPYAPFLLDYFAYPPPFLLVMAPLATLDGDFPAQRALWFGLNGLVLAVGLWIVSRWLDGPRTHRVLLAAPLLFGSLPVLATLQVGDFQIAVVVISVLAMVAFDRGREATGGALLAFAILSKLSPVILGVTLLARRRWRSVAWTAGFGVAFLGLSVLTLGTSPLRAFVGYTLPRLGSGEAFAFLDDDPFSIVTNMSPFGLPFKAQLLGVAVAHPWVIGRVVGRIYTVGLIAITALAAVRRPGERRAQAVAWMALLVLSALQSPFAPGYVLIAMLWAITVLFADVESAGGAVALVVLWLALTVAPPASMLRVAAVQSVAQSLLAVAVPSWLLFRAGQRPRPGPEPAQAG